MHRKLFIILISLFLFFLFSLSLKVSAQTGGNTQGAGVCGGGWQCGVYTGGPDREICNPMGGSAGGGLCQWVQDSPQCSFGSNQPRCSGYTAQWFPNALSGDGACAVVHVDPTSVGLGCECLASQNCSVTAVSPTPQATPSQPPVCSSPCSSSLDCSSAKDGCTFCKLNSTSQAGTQPSGCVPGPNSACAYQSQGTCQTPPVPACNAPCNSNQDCSSAKDGCTRCLLQAGEGSGVCTQPTVSPTHQPAACGVSCSTPSDCADAPGGCNLCISGICRTAPSPTPTPPPPAPACDSACKTSQDCSGARDGCTSCISGTCQSPPACGATCSKTTDCQSAKDGCTLCSGGICKPPAACGVTCSKDSECSGAKDGCTTCTNGTCSAPRPTPSPTPPPTCGISCSKDTECAGARDGCTACVSGVCQQPAACGVTCSKDSECAGAKDGCTMCSGGICKTPPACGVTCAKDTDCAGARDGCTSCIGGVCKILPACNASCNSSLDCAGAQDGCTACVSGTCRTPPACGVSCSKDAECTGARDGCNLCIGGSCQNFDTAMCKCDGIESTPISSGQNSTFTAFAKVEGTDTSKATVQNFTFFMTKDNTIIAKSDPIAAQVVTSSPSKVRYKAVWKQKIPSTVDPNAQYRVWNDISCVRKSTALLYTPSRVVLGTNESTPQKQQFNVFSALLGFFANLFGGARQTVQTSQVPTPTISTTSSESNSGSSLQLGTFSPATSVQNSCRFVMFKFTRQRQ